MIRERPETVPVELWTTFERLGSAERVEARQLLWEPGDDRDSSTFLVLSGLVRIYHPSRDAAPVTLLVVGPGGLLGHHAAMQPHLHATGAETMCASQLLRMPASSVAAWLTGHDAFGRAFVIWLRSNTFRQLAETFTRLEIDHDSARVRVAHVLLALDRQGLLDRMTRQDLADLANLTLETTVRSISRFVREGVLAGSHLTVLSEPERLALAALLEPYEPSELPYS